MWVALPLEAKTEKTTFPSWFWGLQLVKLWFKWRLGGIEVPLPLREVGFFVISLWVFRGQIWYKNMICFNSPILTLWPQLQKGGFYSCKQESRLCPAGMICLSSCSVWYHPSSRDDWWLGDGNQPLLLGQAWWRSSREAGAAKFPASGFILVSSWCRKWNVKYKSTSTVLLLSSTLSNVKHNFMGPVTGPKYKMCTKIMEDKKPRNLQSSAGGCFCSPIL